MLDIYIYMKFTFVCKCVCTFFGKKNKLNELKRSYEIKRKCNKYYYTFE